MTTACKDTGHSSPGLWPTACQIPSICQYVLSPQFVPSWCECLSILHGYFAIAELVSNFVAGACCLCIAVLGSHVRITCPKHLGPKVRLDAARPQEKGIFACLLYYPIQPSLAHRIATLLLSVSPLTVMTTADDADRKRRHKNYVKALTRALPEATRIFTDGSSFGTPGPAGAGFVVYTDGKASHY